MGVTANKVGRTQVSGIRAWGVQWSRVVREDSGRGGSDPGRGFDKEWNEAADGPLGHSRSGALDQDGGGGGGSRCDISKELARLGN